MGDIFQDKIAALLMEARDESYRDGYERGKSDAKRELLAFLGARDGEVADLPAANADANNITQVCNPQRRDANERQRAPKGIVRKFVTRVLNESPGLTPQEMPDRATSDFERMIKVTSIRSELRNGRLQGRYQDDHGHWYLASDGEEVEAEGKSLQGQPSASDSNSDGGEPNAAALI